MKHMAAGYRPLLLPLEINVAIEILELQKATRNDYSATPLQAERNSLAPSRNVEFHGDTKPLLANLRKDAGDFRSDCSQINMFPAPLDLFRQNSLDKR